MNKNEPSVTKKTYTDLEWPINEINHLIDIQLEIIMGGDKDAIEKAMVLSDIIQLKAQVLKDIWKSAFDNHGYLKEVS